MSQPQAPRATVFIGTACPHCGTVLEGLVRMIKDGRLARVEVINVAVDPDAAADTGVRSVPWTRIGPFDLIGSLSGAEIAEWVDYARAGEGWAAYYIHLLENRRLEEVVRRVEASPATLSNLLGVLDDATSMAIRIGISAVVEGLAGSAPLRAVLPQLEQLTLADSAQTRADACHFLGLTGDCAAIPAVRRLLDDEQPDVREIAAETLALLGDTEHTEP
jgi:hypothetical protein